MLSKHACMHGFALWQRKEHRIKEYNQREREREREDMSLVNVGAEQGT